MKRSAVLVLLVLFVFSLMGCAETIDETVVTTEGTEPATVDTKAPKVTTEVPVPEDAVYSYDDLEFMLTIPGAWDGRYLVEREGDTVRLSTDGTLNISLLAVPNDECAPEGEAKAIADGFQFFREGFDQTYYLRVESPLPSDLSWNLNGPVDRTDVTVWDTWMLFSCLEECDEGEMLPYSAAEKVVMLPNGDSYRNYGFGVQLDFPEEWRGSYAISMFQDRLSLTTAKEFIDDPNAHQTKVIFQIIRVRADTRATEVQFAAEDGTLVAKTADAEYSLSPLLMILRSIMRRGTTRLRFSGRYFPLRTRTEHCCLTRRKSKNNSTQKHGRSGTCRAFSLPVRIE